MRLNDLISDIYTDFRKVPKSALLMFYGDNGSGKTKLALETAADITPPDKKILYVDTSQGFVRATQNHPDLGARLDGRLLILPFKGEQQLLLLADAIQNNKENFGSVGCTILDESSSMAQHVLDTVVYARGQNDPSKEEDFATQPDYNIAGNKWRKIHKNFERIYGHHFINVCHFRTDKVKGVEKRSPAFQPTVGNETRKELALIAYCEQEELKEGKIYRLNRRVQVLNTQFALAKSGILGINQDIYYPPESVQEAIRRYYPLDDNQTQLLNTHEIDTEPVEV